GAGITWSQRMLLYQAGGGRINNGVWTIANSSAPAAEQYISSAASGPFGTISGVDSYGSNALPTAQIAFVSTGANTDDGNIVFYTSSGTPSYTLTEAMRITYQGLVKTAGNFEVGSFLQSSGTGSGTGNFFLGGGGQSQTTGSSNFGMGTNAL